MAGDCATRIERYTGGRDLPSGLIADLASCHAAAFAGRSVTPLSKKSWLDFMAQPSRSLWVVRNLETVCGFLLVQLTAPDAEILTIGVAPAYRRQSIGNKLLKTALRDTDFSGVETIHLEVEFENKAAVAFYKTMGFVKVGERKGYYRDGTGERKDALLYCFDLNKSGSPSL